MLLLLRSRTAGVAFFLVLCLAFISVNIGSVSAKRAKRTSTASDGEYTQHTVNPYDSPQFPPQLPPWSSYAQLDPSMVNGAIDDQMHVRQPMDREAFEASMLGDVPPPWMYGANSEAAAGVNYNDDTNSDEVADFLREAGVEENVIADHIRARSSTGRVRTDEHERAFEAMSEEEILQHLDNLSLVSNVMAAFGASTLPDQENHTESISHASMHNAHPDLGNLFEGSNEERANSHHLVIENQLKMNDVPFENCNAGSAQTLTITKVQASIWPPATDTDVTIRAEIQASEDVNDGTYAVKVLLNKVQLFSKSGALNEFIDLPIKKGANTVSKEVHTPSFVPAGEYEVDLQLNDANHQQLACIKIETKIE